MANDVVIRAEGLGKKYLIGHQVDRKGYTALRDVMARGVRGFLRKTVDLAHGRATLEGETIEEFWALRNLNFEVHNGEVLGIIGHNGAGKSTLLKVLSRITEPDEGRATIRGRVASLLEVGTGFHPELTGRENIYLNGAILGMGRAEIRRKFEEIVAFSGIEKFLDTPVKRYSSGMYVRLAFSVAAHLDPDILVIDEILSVGDAEFQKKCLGKISDVAGGGRTILFVSHNMSAIRSLCDRILYLDHGSLAYDGSVESGLEFYSKRSSSKQATRFDWGRGKYTRIIDFVLLDEQRVPTTQYTGGRRLRFSLTFETDGYPGLSFDLFLHDHIGTKIGMASSQHFHAVSLPNAAGQYTAELELAPMWLAAGKFRLDAGIAIPYVGWDHYVESAVEFECLHHNPHHTPFDFRQDYGLGSCALIFQEPINFSLIAAVTE